MQPPNAPEAVPMGRDIPPADWQQPPPSVQTMVLALLKRLEAVDARRKQDATTSQRPPAADSPYKKARKPAGAAPPRKAGGHPGHPGHRQSRLPPTDTRVLTPHPCVGGQTAVALTRPSQTPQGIALPVIQMALSHFVWQDAWCPVCAQWTKAQGPPEHPAGCGPRLTALVGESAGPPGTGRRTLQACWASVLQGPRSLGAIQKRRDRVTHAIAPHDQAMASQARRAPGNDMDDTPWCLTHPLHWLWGMAQEPVACSMVPPHRSTAACAARIEAWAGLLVSAGDGVYYTWVPQRHTCLAPRIRTARGLAERQSPDLAACGAWAWAALQRLCPMATAPPTGGAWRAWYARLCRLIDR